jgi:hypothetical protein
MIFSICPSLQPSSINRGSTSTFHPTGETMILSTRNSNINIVGDSNWPISHSLSLRIFSLERPRGWIDEHSVAIKQGACLGAVKFIRAARSRIPGLELPDVWPSKRGGISVVWEFPDCSIQALIVSDKNQAIYYRKEFLDFTFFEGHEGIDGIIDRVRETQRAQETRSV